jgi:hypothetical protein
VIRDDQNSLRWPSEKLWNGAISCCFGSSSMGASIALETILSFRMRVYLSWYLGSPGKPTGLPGLRQAVSGLPGCQFQRW